MTRGPERSLFRTFLTLGVQNLLYTQAEIDHLDWDLRHTMDEEQGSGITAKYATDWGWHTQGTAKPKPRQYHIIMKIRDKLEKYGIFNE